LDFQVFNLITEADIVSGSKLTRSLRHCGGNVVADVCFRIRCNWRTGLVPEIDEQTAPKPKSRDKIGVLAAASRAWFFRTWHQALTRGGPSAIKYRHGAWTI